MDNQGLTLEGVKIRTGDRPMLDLSAHVAPGEVLTVMGPSGSGKSTLLSVIMGTVDPVFQVSGRVLLDGTDLGPVPTEERRIGLLFQDDLLFPHLTVGANLAFGLSAGVKGRRARTERVQAALADIGLEGYADRDPATLSGGQRARVALMRMLLAEPKALLLDEPFSRLDTDLRDQIRTLVFARARDRGLPVLMVTHDDSDAEAACGRILRVGDGPATPGTL